MNNLICIFYLLINFICFIPGKMFFVKRLLTDGSDFDDPLLSHDFLLHHHDGNVPGSNIRFCSYGCGNTGGLPDGAAGGSHPD
jgi:hypothetical protein